MNVIAVSTEPIALDYRASKNVLIQTAKKNGYTDFGSMDPDNIALDSLDTGLSSMKEITSSGFKEITDKAEMNIHLAD